ncbi:MAG: hypothetical protein NXI10_01615 [bacterium]|nr:hypothetical protein [bacterium]
MKTQLAIILSFFLIWNVTAQNNNGLEDSAIQLHLADSRGYLKTSQQLFIHGKDTLYLDVNCKGGSNRLQPIEPENGNVEIVDSIDVNEDGVKELFLYRKWTCHHTPSVFDQFCIGCETTWTGQYEVWDLKNKEKVFQFISNSQYQRILSTNVVDGGGYQYEVSIDKKGNFHFENQSLQENEESRKGTYKYDLNMGVYQLK